jgi:hypothetical protein
MLLLLITVCVLAIVALIIMDVREGDQCLECDKPVVLDTHFCVTHMVAFMNDIKEN